MREKRQVVAQASGLVLIARITQYGGAFTVVNLSDKTVVVKGIHFDQLVDGKGVAGEELPLAMVIATQESGGFGDELMLAPKGEPIRLRVECLMGERRITLACVISVPREELMNEGSGMYGLELHTEPDVSAFADWLS